MKDLPELYFRIRDNGAIVFRLDTENRHRRLDLEQVAVVNIAKGEFKPHGDRTLTPEEKRSIETWIDARRTVIAERETAAVHDTIERMNLTAQWMQSRATDDQVDALTDDLLMAMHDLRTVLVRRRADRFKAD